MPDGVEMDSGLRGDRALDLALDLPGAARARARSPLDDRLRQQPAPRGAARAPHQRAGRGGRRRRCRHEGREVARAHHGSLAREQRVLIEEDLKAGRIPCLVATSSLELGIDMGAVDLVIQVESPKSVARGLQRVGRAGPRARRRLEGADLPEVPRRPPRVRGRREGDARGRDRGDGDPAQPARRARPAGRRDLRRRRDRRRRAARPRPRRLPVRRAARVRSSTTCSTCSPAATRRTSSPSCGRGSCGTAPPASSAGGRAPAGSP